MRPYLPLLAAAALFLGGCVSSRGEQDIAESAQRIAYADKAAGEALAALPTADVATQAKLLAELSAIQQAIAALAVAIGNADGHPVTLPAPASPATTSAAPAAPAPASHP